MRRRHACLALVTAASVHSLQLELPGLRAYRDAAAACAAVATQPQDSESWRRLGKLLHGKGRLEASRSALSRAAALDPQSHQAHIDLANVLRSAGRFGESIEALLGAKAISGAPDQSMCYFGAPTHDGEANAAAGANAQGRPASPGSNVLLTPFATTEECDWVIATAERFNAARGGWGNPPPRYAPAGTVADAVRAPHMLVADCPELLEWYNRKLQAVVWPTLRAQFGEGATEGMWLYDAFLLKFDAQPGRAGLGLHVDDDGLGLSTNVLLSSPADFDGGGTFFEDGSETVTPAQGEMVSHHGGLRHSSVPTVGGLRYILVAFLRAPSLIAEPPPYIDVRSVCQATMAEVAQRQGQG